MDIIILAISILFLIRGKYAWVLVGLLALTTRYFGIGSNLSTFPVEHNVSDSGLILYIFLYFYLLSKNNFRIRKSKISTYVGIFYLFLFVSFIVDIAINHVGFTSIIKTSRHWIYLTAIWVFYFIPFKETKKLLKILLKITAIVTVIMLFEYVSGLKIIGTRITTELSDSGKIFRRAPIPSSFTFFLILLLFMDLFNLSKKLKWFYILLFLGLIISSIIRSLLLATIIGIIMVFWFKGNLSSRKLLGSLVIVTTISFVVLLSPTINERFKSGFDEISSLDIQGDIEGNISFRFLHFYERFKYVISHPQYAFFGIGNITEENSQKVFNIGLFDKNGDIIQLDTGDIVWSRLFLRLGILGTFLYLLFYFKFLKSIFRQRNNPKIFSVLTVYLSLHLLIISFASAHLAIGSFWILPILIYTQFKQQNETTTINNHSNTIV